MNMNMNVQPIVEDVDEEVGGGGNTLGEPPRSARPSLRGLDRELSTRFGNTTTTTTTASSGSGGEQQQQHVANFSDYLKAQRTLKSHRHLSPSNNAALNRQAVDVAVAGSETTDNDTDNKTPALQANLAAATFAAKLRKRANASNTNNTGNRSFEEQKTLRALGQLGRRGSVNNLNIQDSVPWDDIFTTLETIDDDGHFADHDHDVMLPWYASPVQQQRWGEDQSLPHVNWGDLFFDLFYVAAAYNLGGLLMSAMNAEQWLRGIIYYVGAFGPLWSTWEVSMFYESRYTSVDYAHRLFEVVRYLFVSTAVMHVKSVELLGDPKSAETLLFTLAIFGEALMHLVLSIELYFRGLGDKETIKNHTLVKIKTQQLPMLLIYLAAFVTAAVFYAQPEDKDTADYGNVRLLASATPADTHAADGDYDTSYSKYETAASEPLWKLSDLPLTLTAIAYLQNGIVIAWRKMRITSGKHGDIRHRYVPSNIDYVIHRYGEWILLMIGEGILSLLIVETVEIKDYYIITTFGILTIIFIQILKFESEPTHAEGHAMWQNLHNAMCYSYLIQLLSMALIVFGVTYKVFLKGVLKDKESKMSRMLAESPVISDAVSAHVFSGSLLVVLLSLELTCLTHSGYTRALEHLVRPKGGRHGQNTMPHWPVVIIALSKAGILCFTLTLSQWTTDPAILTICGCFIVLALASTRVMNFFFIHKKEMIQELTNTVRTTVRRATELPPVISASGEKVCMLAKNTLSNVSVSISNACPELPPAISASGERVSMLAKTTLSNASVSISNSCRSTGDKGGEDTVTMSTSNHSTGSASDEEKSEDGSSSIKTTSAISDFASSGMNASFDAIVVADLNGIITQVNDTTVTLFGYATKKEIIGKNLSILVGGGDAKRHDGYMKAFKSRVTTHENPQHKVLGRQRMLHACRADGTEFPCIIGIKMVSNDTRIAGYIRDMSGMVSKEKKKVSTTMADEDAIKKIVENHAFDAIIASDEHGIIQRVNETAVTEFGYRNKKELVGENISVLIHGATPEQLFENNGKQRLVTLTRNDGTEFQSIVASNKIKGTSHNMFSIYVRNIDSIRHGIKCEKCD